MTFKHGDWRRPQDRQLEDQKQHEPADGLVCRDDAMGRWVAKSPLAVGAASGGENDTKRLIKQLIVRNEDKPPLEFKSEFKDEATTPKRLIKGLIASSEE